MKIKHSKYWERLLIEWRALGRDGLTIPYIIGSQQFLLTTHINQNIEELLIDIASNKECEVYITYCPNINEIILGIRDSSKRKIAGHFPPLEGKDQSKLFLTSFVENLGTDVEVICLSLTVKFQGHIDGKHFSKRGDEWVEYSTGEKEFIRSCFID